MVVAAAVLDNIQKSRFYCNPYGREERHCKERSEEKELCRTKTWMILGRENQGYHFHQTLSPRLQGKMVVMKDGVGLQESGEIQGDAEFAFQMPHLVANWEYQDILVFGGVFP